MIDFLKNIYQRLLVERNELRRWNRRQIQGTQSPRVYYGNNQIAGAEKKVWGGLVKLQDLIKIFPNKPLQPNLLYLISSALPPHAMRMADIAVKNEASLVINQNGVAYPAWCPVGWRQVNVTMKKLLHKADHVFYQSEFCKIAADEFLGQRTGSSEVLYNPVDMRFFVPGKKIIPKEKYLRLLLAGSHNRAYRVRVAIQTLSILRQRAVDAKLIIAGRYAWKRNERHALLEARQMAQKENVVDFVEFRGAYLQSEAAQVFQNADMLLHTTYNDACPRLVIEAMACGLPVVYSRSGGVPELVGEDCGVGVFAPLDWEDEHPPDADGLAEAVIQVDLKRMDYSIAARKRASTLFNVDVWIKRHQEIFESLV